MEDISVLIRRDMNENPYVTATEICKRYNLSHYELKKMGFVFRYRRRPTEQTINIIRDVRDGKHPKAVAEKYGVSRQRVYNIIKEYDKYDF